MSSSEKRRAALAYSLRSSRYSRLPDSLKGRTVSENPGSAALTAVWCGGHKCIVQEKGWQRHQD